MIKGKALLVIEKLDSKHVPFNITVCIQSCSSENSNLVKDEFSLIETRELQAPLAAYRLKIGERIWIKVVYEFTYHQDYVGEWDISLEYLKQQVIKRRRLK